MKFLLKTVMNDVYNAGWKIENIDCIVIDEISMVAPDLLDAIDILARYARRNNEPFGGIQVVAIGDLFQLPPVITRDAMQYYSDEYGNPNSYFFDSHVYNRANFIKYNFDFNTCNAFSLF